MKKKIIILLTLGLAIGSCESLDLTDGTNNYNLEKLEEADPTILLNQVQMDFARFHYELHSDTKGPVRMVAQFGTYNAAADPENTQTQWRLAYAHILRDIKLIEDIGKQKPIPHHIAIAKIFKAYTMVDLVDFYGDVPYSQALLGESNLNPKVDSGDKIYDAMLVELDQALTLLGQNNVTNYTDLYYGRNTLNWRKLANSLKLKMYNNLRLTRDVSAPVNAILAGGVIFSSNADDFNFRYSTSIAPADSRHPDFTANYFAGKDYYMSNVYMRLLIGDKTANLGTDPRLRSYFFRQSRSNPSGANLPCSGNPAYICYIGGGYWGRDHADATGVPNDATLRTIVGLYPMGGVFDNSTANYNVDGPGANKGALGQGLLNIFDFSHLQFMLAELALTEPGVNGTPLTLLTDAVTQNIAKVRAFRTDLQGSNASTAANVTNYLNEINSDYTALTSNNNRLNYIMKEFFISLWGNGFEAYNAYRRTGMILNDGSNRGMQSPVTGAAAGKFIRSFPYPRNAINNNANLVQKQQTVRVFWDNNPENGFID